jgi:hypothetical protein
MLASPRMVKGDVFTCPATGLSIRKPPDWEWIPGTWMRPESEPLTSASEEPEAVLDAGQIPIACLTRPHGSANHMDPTVQLFRRLMFGAGDLGQLADALRVTLPQVFHRCRFLELTTDAILAGHRALRYEIDYTLVVEPEVEFRCRCLAHVVLHGAHALTLTIATTTAKRYRFDEDLGAILGSVTFGAGRRAIGPCMR